MTDGAYPIVALLLVPLYLANAFDVEGLSVGAHCTCGKHVSTCGRRVANARMYSPMMMPHVQCTVDSSSSTGTMAGFVG